MIDNSTHSEANPPAPLEATPAPDTTGTSPKKSPPGGRAAAPSPTPKTVRGQRYVAPIGRHSQQTHLRAQERAAAAGHATETEQHAFDRNVVVSQLQDRTEQKQKQQRKQDEQNVAPKSKAQPDSPGKKQA